MIFSKIVCKPHDQLEKRESCDVRLGLEWGNYVRHIIPKVNMELSTHLAGLYSFILLKE